MSKGNDGRSNANRDGSGRRGGERDGRPRSGSRTSIHMTPERARAIQAHADKTGQNQDFKSRAMSAADRHADDSDDGDDN